jgi:hypothetical protein
MNKKELSKRILVSITGNKDIHWQSKLKEIKKHRITRVALFLEIFKRPQREKIYKALLKSDIKTIPLVHIRNDMDKEELKFLAKNFKPKYFTIHEDSFDIMEKWKGYYKKLFLEMNYDNFISRKVDVSKIGGFCIDISHFKAGEEKWSKEFKYILGRRKNKNIFACNHLNGYSYKKNIDLHTIKDLKEFDYLKTFNKISEQLKFKKHIIEMLGK